MMESRVSHQPSVRIMMATYNGEKYISKQIDSILNQTYLNWSMVIQDDGSTDKTESIVSNYCDERITFRFNPETRHGPLINFHSIANQEKLSGNIYDYYMFCDQDDIWDIDKIERMVRYISAKDDSIPQLCNSDMRIIDGDDNIVHDSICDLQGLRYKNCASLFFSFFVYGCSIIMNQKAFFAVPVLDMVDERNDILQHDSLYPIFAGLLGEIHLFPEITMSYRRHGNNFSKNQRYGFGVNRIITRIMDFKKLARDHAAVYNQTIMISQMISEITNCLLVDEAVSAIKKGGIAALRFMRYNKVDCGNNVKNLSRQLILLTKLHIPYLI